MHEYIFKWQKEEEKRRRKRELIAEKSSKKLQIDSKRINFYTLFERVKSQVHLFLHNNKKVGLNNRFPYLLYIGELYK